MTAPSGNDVVRMWYACNTRGLTWRRVSQLRSNCIKSQDMAEEGSQGSFSRALSSPSAVSSPSRAASAPSRSDSGGLTVASVELAAGDAGFGSSLALRRQGSQSVVDAVAHLTIDTGSQLPPAQSPAQALDAPASCAAGAEGGAATEGGGKEDEDDDDDEASDWDESDDWSDEEDLAAFELEVASFLAAVKHLSRSVFVWRTRLHYPARRALHQPSPPACRRPTFPLP